jgi:uroporphyrinogen decarboxylase
LQKLNKDVDVDAALGYVYDAIKLTRESISNRVPIYGFCGGPWTVMTY